MSEDSGLAVVQPRSRKESGDFETVPHPGFLIHEHLSDVFAAFLGDRLVYANPGAKSFGFRPGIEGLQDVLDLAKGGEEIAALLATGTRCIKGGRLKFEIDGVMQALGASFDTLVLDGKKYLVVTGQDTTAVESEAERSIFDTLTGLPNREAFKIRYAFERSLLRRKRIASFGLMVLDIDHFKQVNDTYGHLAGDEVLIHVSKIVQAAVRDTDSACRVGGEEIAIIAPDVSLDRVTEIAQRVRLAVDSAKIETSAGIIPVTVSIGVMLETDPDCDRDSSFKKADKALYAAKAAGRNTVMVSAQ